ncbi:hypothetical protein ACHAXN_000981 [Cyclotella atomus]
MAGPEQLTHIINPHTHDVLSGRGNIANRHPGNEHFRSLVKNYKNEYVTTAKSSKPLCSQLIYNEIRSMQPPGRFLKQDPKTKLWHDIGKKAALAKTRQALREGAPEIMMDLKTAAHFRQTLAQDLHQQNNIVANVTSESAKAVLSNYLPNLPRSESNASISSDSLLSLSSGNNNNGTFQFSGSLPNQVFLSPSLVSSISGDGNNNQVQMQNDWQQQHQLQAMPNAVNTFGPVPSMLQFFNTTMPSVSNSQSNPPFGNEQNNMAENSSNSVGNTFDNTKPVDQPTSNDANANVLLALLASINSNNVMINQNINQVNLPQQEQMMNNCAPGTLLQQLQSQQAYQQLINQFGLPQHSSSSQNEYGNNFSSGMANSA